MRLFFAVTFTESSQKRLAQLTSTLTSGRLIPYGLIHLTLLFLGEVDHHCLSDLRAILPTLTLPSPNLSVPQLGAFERGRSSIVWAAIRPEEPFIALHHELGEAVSQLGIAFDRKRFVPHITLARKISEPLPSLPGHVDLTAHCVALIHSHSERGTLTYSPLASVPL